MFIIGVCTENDLNILKQKSDTDVSVWYKNFYSYVFQTSVGVKQVALLRPLLLSIFINEIEDDLFGGININETRVKVLALLKT